jgi:ABC-type multidrug transport system ATPase subunit
MSLEIQLHQIGRRFNRDWIFKDIHYHFESGKRYAILGRNGAGKSTLLKVISGILTPSSGTVEYVLNGQSLPIEQVYKHLSIATPYMELIEDFTLNEMVDFHFNFKSYLAGYKKELVLDYMGLSSSLNKPLRFFSSGMKQRVKLTLACMSEGEVLMLDEPTSNFDQHAIHWYHELLEKTVKNRILIVCSNQPEEYKTCTEFLRLAEIESPEAK